MEYVIRRILAEIADGLACAVFDRTDAGAESGVTARAVVAAGWAGRRVSRLRVAGH